MLQAQVGTADTLQEVTDLGNTTTNAITFAGGTSTGDLILGTTSSPVDLFLFGDTTGVSLTWSNADDELQFSDNAKAVYGDSGDLQLWHDGTKSRLDNYTGSLEIANYADDSDIVFKSDDGSGGIETYMYLDGGNNNIKFQKDANWIDNEKALFGTGSDLQIWHGGIDSYFVNWSGNLYLINKVSNKHIIFSTNNTERARITSGGNLLIGTTTDSGEKLVVDGTAKVEQYFYINDTGNTNNFSIRIMEQEH
jgi:hypothetical protein